MLKFRGRKWCYLYVSGSLNSGCGCSLAPNHILALETLSLPIPAPFSTSLRSGGGLATRLAKSRMVQFNEGLEVIIYNHFV